MKANDNKHTNNGNIGNGNTTSKSTKKLNTLTAIRQASRINANGEKERCFALRVNPETVDVNHQRSEVTYILIGGAWHLCILKWDTVDSDETYDAIMDFEWAEAKREDRSRRCLLRNGKGGFIRCPEQKGKKCSECKLANRFSFSANRLVSLDALLEGNNYEPKTPYTPDLTVVETMELLEQMIVELNKRSPKYGEIFLALFYGTKKIIKIAKKLNIPEKNIYKDVAKVRKLAQEIYQRLTTI